MLRTGHDERVTNPARDGAVVRLLGVAPIPLVLGFGNILLGDDCLLYTSFHLCKASRFRHGRSKLDAQQSHFLSAQNANTKPAAYTADQPVRASGRLRTTAHAGNRHLGRFYRQLGLRRAAAQAQDQEGTR